MNILIVTAHPEPGSFSNALAHRAQAALERQGHTVTFNDLHALGFQPVSDRRNFTTTLDPAYLKPQAEEAHATTHDGFAPDLEAELKKLEAADALIFAFPLWWFGLPAQLKGWVDRVFAYDRVYGNGKLYENGLGQARKRALVLMTTGGPAHAYDGHGFNPPMETILAPIHHGIFWFNGFLPLDPFVAYGPAHLDAPARAAVLDALDARLATFATEEPRHLPPLADFPDWGRDRQPRFMVTVRRTRPVDAAYQALVPAELAAVAQLKRRGIVRAFTMTPPDAPDWRAFLELRAPDAAAARAALHTLPLAAYLGFEIHPLAQV